MGYWMLSVWPVQMTLIGIVFLLRSEQSSDPSIFPAEATGHRQLVSQCPTSEARRPRAFLGRAR
jgi:hypothetical protein